MTGSELGESHRQIAIGPDLLPKQLHVTRTIHRFQRESAFVVRELKHVGAEFSPMTAAFRSECSFRSAGKELPRAGARTQSRALLPADEKGRAAARVFDDRDCP